jgi:hypothetical protein
MYEFGDTNIQTTAMQLYLIAFFTFSKGLMKVAQES